MNRLPDTTVLLPIDIQQAFNNPSWGERNNPDAERRAAELLAAWREKKLPIIHVQHVNPRAGSLFNPGTIGARPKPEAEPLEGEPVITKDVNSAFIGTDLEKRLREQGITTIVTFGLTTDHCVSTTTRMGGNLGFNVFVVEDASATHERTSPSGKHYTAQEMHDTALASLSGEFATVVSTADVLGAIG